ncbi:LysM peptidoglycan-binding domain-containing protein [Patescibacteria group bacterium]|nr:LysM peptidoglycan-binding domain-containing protein [Patescibacteria group bacterium]
MIPKGSSKDPFFYVGIISIILFLILVFLSKPEILEKTLTAKLNSSITSQNLFLGSGESFLVESPNLFFVQKNSLRAASPPLTVTPKVLGSLIGDSRPEVRGEIIEYSVQSGDSLWNIAADFEISLDTLLWANDLNKNSKILPGQKLIILPVSGVVHHVQKGESLSEIAQDYKAEFDKIISLNELSGEDIFIGDILIIPDGVMPSRSYTVAQIPVASSYFICPIPSPCRITQGLHWYNAIDFSNGKCGEPIYAVAGGLVQKTGYGRISGNFIRIEHPNGIVTVYGHLSKILVSPGQNVLQGDKIGYTGYSGYTIPAGPAGCHLHFEVRGARNPFAK